MEIQENFKYRGWENCIRLINGEVELDRDEGSLESKLIPLIQKTD